MKSWCCVGKWKKLISWVRSWRITLDRGKNYPVGLFHVQTITCAVCKWHVWVDSEWVTTQHSSHFLHLPTACAANKLTVEAIYTCAFSRGSRWPCWKGSIADSSCWLSSKNKPLLCCVQDRPAMTLFTLLYTYVWCCVLVQQCHYGERACMEHR